MGTNAVSHHPLGSQLPITVLLFVTDQPANPSQRATVKTQTHLDNAVTLTLKCLSFILLCEKNIFSFALCVLILSFEFLSQLSLSNMHTYTHSNLQLFNQGFFDTDTSIGNASDTASNAGSGNGQSMFLNICVISVLSVRQYTENNVLLSLFFSVSLQSIFATCTVCLYPHCSSHFFSWLLSLP